MPGSFDGGSPLRRLRRRFGNVGFRRGAGLGIVDRTAMPRFRIVDRLRQRAQAP